ncbi:uncharacterized protein LOC133341190 [Lethenteron reissneri]|uniref:uncharacterized protein LOC133341190 n=1 Tax=Lethenteron reissneri TaxID=7753 RepID=UPI002AB7988E|nr:uncharacterized protein LOC133341190 [Lethenteron reissneri]
MARAAQDGAIPGGSSITRYLIHDVEETKHAGSDEEPMASERESPDATRGDTRQSLMRTLGAAALQTATQPKPKKARVSRALWHDEYFETSQATGDVQSRTCKICTLQYAGSTSSGTRIKHLKTHGIVDPESPTVVTSPPTGKGLLVQSKMATPMSAHASKAMDSFVAEYIATSGLGHKHVTSDPFKTLLQRAAPGYEPKSERTVKRRMLEMYVVLKLLVLQYFTTFGSCVSLTYDGWTNDAMTGFFSVTLHWMDPASFSMCNCIIHFFWVAPGEGVGKRMAQRLHELLDDFGVWPRLLAVVTDSGSDAVASAKSLMLLEGSNLRSTCCLRCIVHCVNLGVKASFGAFETLLRSLRATLGAIRKSKTKRAAYTSLTRHYLKCPLQPPCLKVVTHWGSTYVMLTASLRQCQVIDAICLEPGWSRSQADLSDEQWEQAALLCQFLEKPAAISDAMGAEEYCTISNAITAQEALLSHCMTHRPSPHVVVSSAAVTISDYMVKYSDLLSSEPSRVARFLDLRHPKPAASSTKYSNIKDMMTDILNQRYPALTTDAAPKAAPRGGINILFDMVYAPNAHDGAASEVDRFLLEPTQDLSMDVVEWWKLYGGKYPRLRRVALDYLPIPASSVPSERANSAAKRSFLDRPNLHKCTFKAEMCVRSPLRETS